MLILRVQSRGNFNFKLIFLLSVFHAPSPRVSLFIVVVTSKRGKFVLPRIMVFCSVAPETVVNHWHYLPLTNYLLAHNDGMRCNSAQSDKFSSFFFLSLFSFRCTTVAIQDVTVVGCVLPLESKNIIRNVQFTRETLVEFSEELVAEWNVVHDLKSRGQKSSLSQNATEKKQQHQQ